jgi:hypothetical protein
VHAYLNQAMSRWDAEEMLAATQMDSAEIVFTTLSSTGRRAFERGRRFDLVLIDEAAQASEAATLQPLTLGSGKYVIALGSMVPSVGMLNFCDLRVIDSPVLEEVSMEACVD